MNKSEIHNILVITLSNLGDVILTFPVIDILKRDFPQAQLSVVAGPKAEALLKENPCIHQTYIFDKAKSGWQKFSWIQELRRQKFDLVIDLRNTAIPFLIQGKHSTPPQIFRPKVIHMKTKHLNRLKSVFNFDLESNIRYALSKNEKDIRYVDDLITNRIGAGKRIFVVAPGAANHIKRWTPQGFGQVCDHLAESLNAKIVFVGDTNDKAIIDDIFSAMHRSYPKTSKSLSFPNALVGNPDEAMTGPPTKIRLQRDLANLKDWRTFGGDNLGISSNNFLNLCSETTITQLAELLRRSTLALTNDSAVMHLASYLDIPVVAIFGPTDPRKYGPWSSHSIVVRKNIFCSPCEKSGCAYHHECMRYIEPEEVLRAVQNLLMTTRI